MNKMNWDDLMQLKGQIINLFEDFLESNGIRPEMVPNEEREEAIRDGADPDGCAIIYGGDYDVIVGCIEATAMEQGMDVCQREKIPISISAGMFERLRRDIMAGFESILNKIDESKMNKETDAKFRSALKTFCKEDLQQSHVEQIFQRWEILEPPRTKEYWTRFAEGLTFQEGRDLMFVLERPYTIEDIEEVLEYHPFGETESGQWMMLQLTSLPQEEKDAYLDAVIGAYQENEDASKSYWENLTEAMEYATEIHRFKEKTEKTEPLAANDEPKR